MNQYYKQALQNAQETGDKQGEPNALGNLGNIHDDLGEYHLAIEYYETSFDMSRVEGDTLKEGITLWDMSICHFNLGNKTKAIALAEKLLKIREAM